MQIQSVFSNPDNLKTEYPPSYSQYVEQVGSYANLDLYSFFNVDCSIRLSFLDTAMVYLFLPTLILALAFVKLGPERKRGRGGERRRLLPPLPTLPALSPLLTLAPLSPLPKP